jgi:hypothetical protein
MIMIEVLAFVAFFSLVAMWLAAPKGEQPEVASSSMPVAEAKL